MRTGLALLLLTLAAAPAAHADEPTPTNEPRFDFSAIRRHGGPDSVQSALRADAAGRESFFRFHAIESATRPYAWFKKRVNERHGLAFGLDYNFLHEAASASLGDEQATGGVFRFYWHWTLTGKGTPTTGEFVFRIENRHAIGGGVPPESFYKEIGAVLKTANSFSDFGWGFTNLQWQQWFKDGRYGIAVGEVDLRDWVDTFDLSNWRTALLSAATTYPTNPLPSAGLGAAAFAWFRERNTPYVIAGFSDANGRNEDLGFDTIGRKEFYSFVEGGWTPSFEEKDKKNVRFTYWHQDEATHKGVDGGWGLSFSAHWRFDDKWSPFLRAGIAEGGAIPTESGIVAGLGIHQRSHDLFGTAVGWARPTDRSLRDQVTWETFYRLQLSRNIGITPGIEVLFNPSNNPTQSTIAVLNLRFQIAM